MAFSYFHDFIALFFPQLCGACGRNLYIGETEICKSCLYKLPYTHFHQDAANPVARQFWGRIPLVQAGAYLHFNKGGRVKQLMHQLKYRNRQNLAELLGELYGHQLKQSDHFITPNLILPVPLHPKKLKKRGYNQSECIARGMARALDLQLDTQSLKRGIATETQTKKSRFLRYENMQDAFTLGSPETLQGQHVLLVDDVITTGATLEACAQILLNKAEVTISIAALAYAE